MFPKVGGKLRFSRDFLTKLLEESDSIDSVFDSLLEFVEKNENFLLEEAFQVESEDDEANDDFELVGDEFKEENIYSQQDLKPLTEEQKHSDKQPEIESDLTDEVILVLYSEFRLEYSKKNDTALD